MADTRKNNARLITILMIVVIIVAAIAIYSKTTHQKKTALAIAANLKIDGTILPKPHSLKPFNLTSNTDTPYTKNNLKGHWTLMFFGFTNCAYVCPTTMSAMNKMYQQLQTDMPKIQLPQVVMISVDPARDSVKRMNGYVKAFNPNFIGARGSMPELKALTKQLSIAFMKKETKDGHYTISHSAEVMLLDPDGNLRAYFSYPHTGKQMAQDYEHIIKAAYKNA